MTRGRGYALTILVTRKPTETPLPTNPWLVVGCCPHGTSSQTVMAGSATGLRARRYGLTTFHRLRMPPLEGLRIRCHCPLVAFLTRDEEVLW